MSSRTPSVLIVRINSEVEITNSSAAVDFVREQFPNCRLITVSAPNSEGLHLLLADKRISKVHIVDAPAGSRPAHLLKTLKSIGPLVATVIFRGFTPGQNYDRLVLTGFVFGGAKYIVDKSLKLNRLLSLSSLYTVLCAARQKLTSAAENRDTIETLPEQGC